MPLYNFACDNGHAAERFFHRAEDGINAEFACETCGEPMHKAFSMGRGLTWAEEGRPRTIHNLGPEPVVVRSHREHERLMRQQGVTWANAGQGYKGAWV